ncbi:hypothetical protein [Anaerosporomusa subterranea]|uniref:hypothetical protein n=1 Tax=Anaerosporomusa subterranea TaxID=1794912 RepID=UPI0012E7E920|nr:hypothetical protein [Anaerosporomusa subterranea]
MKRKIILLMLVLVVAFSATASAKPHDHWKDDDRSYRSERHDKHDRNDRYEKRNSRWDHPSYRNNSWRKTQHAALPFTWYEHRDRFYRPGHTIERIHDNRWSNRFPGLYAYRWQDIHGNGFWYQGRYVRDAVMFYNDSDELVSVGFMHNGAFLFIRDDDGGYENRDSFFLSWGW